MPHIIRLRKYTQLRIHNQIQAKNFKWIETYRTLTNNQQINLSNYCRGKKILSPRSFSIAGASAPVSPVVPPPMVIMSSFFVGGDGLRLCSWNSTWFHETLLIMLFATYDFTSLSKSLTHSCNVLSCVDLSRPSNILITLVNTGKDPNNYCFIVVVIIIIIQLYYASNIN